MFLFFLLYWIKEFNRKFYSKKKKNQQCLADVTLTPLGPMIYQCAKCAKCYFLMRCQIKSFSSAADTHYQRRDSGGGVTCSVNCYPDELIRGDNTEGGKKEATKMALSFLSQEVVPLFIFSSCLCMSRCDKFLLPS